MSTKITDLRSYRKRKLYEQKEEIISISLNELEAITYMGILEGLSAVAEDEVMWGKLRQDILENDPTV
jgi:hypothetical protein